MFTPTLSTEPGPVRFDVLGMFDQTFSNLRTVTLDQIVARHRWIRALRSGNYQQARRTLHDTDKGTFCCLGVACEIVAPKVEGAWNDFGDSFHYIWNNVGLYSGGILPPEIARDIYGLTSGNPAVRGVAGGHDSAIANLNDSGWTFDRIADALEQVYLMPFYGLEIDGIGDASENKITVEQFLHRVEWLDALRSDSYKQAKGRLKIDPTVQPGCDGEMFCCLGVASDLSGTGRFERDMSFDDSITYRRLTFVPDEPLYGNEWAALPVPVQKWLGIGNDDVTFEYAGDSVRFASEFNDEGGTFDQIADLIEAQYVTPALIGQQAGIATADEVHA